MSLGRPKWIPDELTCRKAQEMASKGLTVSQIAHCLGISHTTLYERQNEFPEFADAIKKGRAEGINQVANKLFEKAIDGDNTCIIFYLKNRDRESWGDQHVEPVKEIPPINITVHPDAVNATAK
jgi:hypothetical protein